MSSGVGVAGFYNHRVLASRRCPLLVIGGSRGVSHVDRGSIDASGTVKGSRVLRHDFTMPHMTKARELL